MRGLFLKMCDSALDCRRVTYVAWAAVVTVACLGLLRLSFSYDYRSFFDTANPELQAFNKIENEFAPTDSVNFVLYSADGSMLAPSAAETLDWLTSRSLDIPYAMRSQSAANYQFSYAQADDLVVEPLFKPLRSGGFNNLDTLDFIQRRAASEVAIMGRLFSPDFKTAQVIVDIRMPPGQSSVLPVIKAEVEVIKRELAARAPDLRVATTGVVLLSQSFFEVTVRDMLFLFPAITALILVLLTWFFRSWRAAALCMLVITLSILMAMGIAGWAGVALTPATGPAPLVIMTVALVDSVHLIAGFLKSLSVGRARREAAQHTLRHNMRAVFLTSVTTAMGFLSLNFSDTPPFRELGNICALGTLLAMLLSLTLLPALMVSSNIASARRAKSLNRSLFQNMGGFIYRGRRSVIMAACMFTGASGYLLTQIDVRDNFVEWIGTSHPFRGNAEFIQAKLPSLFTQQYAVRAPEGSSVTNPKYLKDLEAFAQFAESQPGVAHVLSFDTVMRRLNKNLHEDDEAYNTLPDAANEAAQYLLLYEMSLPPGEDLTTLLTIGRQASRMVVTLEPQTSSQMQDLRETLLSWAGENLNHAQATAGTGTNMIFAELTRSNTRSMLVGSIVAALGIGTALMFALRNLKLGALSLVPNIGPPLYAFAVWAVFVGSVGLYGAFLVTTALGLIVDATVHMLEKYQGFAKSGVADPVAKTLEDVGPAILVSGAVLLAGFTVLTFSSFAIISNLAQLLIITLVLAFVTDFLLLPALLYVFAAPGNRPVSTS